MRTTSGFGGKRGRDTKGKGGERKKPIVKISCLESSELREGKIDRNREKNVSREKLWTQFILF